MSGSPRKRAVLVTALLVLGLLASLSVAVVAQGLDPRASPLPSPAGSGSPVATAEPSASVAPSLPVIPEGTWQATSFDAFGAGEAQPLAGSVLTVIFGPEGRLDGETSCGGYLGGYTANGGAISIGIMTTGTSPCGGWRADEQFDFAQALQAAATWSATETGLELLDNEGLRRVALVRPKHGDVVEDWVVVRYRGAGGELTEPLPGTELAISFGADGQVEGSAGCRIFRGGYFVEAGRIAIGPLKASGLPCEGADRRQQRRYMRALEGAISWARADSVLLLSDAVGEPLVELVRFDSGSEALLGRQAT